MRNFVSQLPQRRHKQKASTNEETEQAVALTLPSWIENYLQWHREMRVKFPNETLFTDPNAPKLLIRTCTVKCGGLHDRLGKIPWDVYLANRTNRVLLYHWCKPANLENYLQPNKVDWTVPAILSEYFVSENTVCSKTVDRQVPDLFHGLGNAKRPSEEFWTTTVSEAIERAKNGSFADKRILREEILGIDQRLDERLPLQDRGIFAFGKPYFGALFHTFFQPVPRLQQKIDSAMAKLKLVKNQFAAVHCRVRHPKATSSYNDLESKEGTPGGPDRSGLKWEGKSKLYAIEIATGAMKCIQKLVKSEPVYFLADSEDLVRFMSHDVKAPGYEAPTEVELQALNISRQIQIVSRNDGAANLHLDRQGGSERDPTEFDPTFVDLLIASQARCIGLGIGSYALFAGKLSGTTCIQQYAKESWGKSDIDILKEKTSQQCEL